MKANRRMNPAAAATGAPAAGGERRSLPRWTIILLLALAILALALNAAWWLRETKTVPLPAIPMEELESPVAALIESARQEVERDGQSAMAWGNLGAALRAHDIGPQADVCFRNAQALDPSDYRWPYLLGISLIATDGDESLSCFRRAAALCGERPHVYLRLAESLLDRRLMAEAKAVIDQVLAFAPAEPRAQLAQARWLFLEGQVEQSRQWAEKSAAGAPDKRAPHLLLAQIYRRLVDRAKEAREMEVLKTIPDGITPWEDPDVEVVFGLRQDRAWRLRTADQLAMSGRFEEAADTFADLAHDNDRSAEATLKLVQAFFRQRKYAEAEHALREQLRRHNDNERIHFQLGVACFLQDQYGAAAHEFRRATELKPDHVDAYYNLGHALRKNDQPAEAQEAFAAAVSLSPGHSHARANLAELLLAAGQNEEAAEHLETAARLDPDDPKVRELLKRSKSRSP